MAGRRPAQPHAVQEGDDGGRLAGDPAQHHAVPVLDRLRAGDAAAGQMLHEAEEERQVGGRHPLLVEGEDEIALAGVDQEIGVLDPLGDALVGEQLADVVAGQEGLELLRRNVGIDRHHVLRSSRPAIGGGASRQGKSEQAIGHADPGMPIFRPLSGHRR